MLAPCSTVLSTSKNAAAVGSPGTLSAVSTSALAAAASPASCERRLRSSRGERRLWVTTPRLVAGVVEVSAHDALGCRPPHRRSTGPAHRHRDRGLCQWRAGHVAWARRGGGPGRG